MSIDNLRISANANFHQLTATPTAKDIDKLFKKLRGEVKGAKYPVHFRQIRNVHKAATWSAIAFSYPRVATMLPEGGKIETVVGYVLLVEHKDHLAVFKSGLDLTPDFKKMFTQRLSQKTVQTALAAKDSVFEKIRVRNLSPSKSVLRSKMLEADDIAAVVGAAGNSRYAPQSFALVRGQQRFATTLSTARIGQRLDRQTHLQAVEWASAMIDQLTAPPAETASFLNIFAEPVDLATVAATPSAFIVSVPILKDMLFDAEVPRYRLVTSKDGVWIPIDHDDAIAFVDKLDVAFKLTAEPGGWALENGGGNLKQTKIGISLSNLTASEGCFVESLGDPAGEAPVPLRSFINRENLFMVIFNDPSVAWLSGALFRDNTFFGADQAILKYLKPRDELKAANDEKGNFEDKQEEFADRSVFRIIVDNISSGDTALVCDDLNDEWADFIGIGDLDEMPILTFYHAKHGKISLGASPFHVAVSQGIKNLGRLSPPKDAIPEKVASWDATYNNKKKQTAIQRILRGGTSDEVGRIYEAVRTAPEAIKRVSIVTSSLSKKQVEDALDAVRKGATPDPHFVQLYWLLSSFFSACAEAGVAGSVICQP
nr:hypothetical protein [uncultured Brevundimonas sp.]